MFDGCSSPAETGRALSLLQVGLRLCLEPNCLINFTG